ncbi:MAG: envelope stress response membrane protein PspC [Sphingomonadales bacterium]|nr:envelope stress response membrane protein PspC [Sphingomonadales bacterium]MDE2170517.1 envelope stress response membrane protein PspC [Sphingomonadales bacterium]
MNPLRTKFYKDKANGKFMGVCAGIADYTGVDILWVRLGMLGLMWLSGGVVFMAYIAAGILAENKPSGMYADRQEEKFWQGVRQSPSRTTRDVRADFRDIDRRLAAVEAYYVSSNPRLSEEIEKLR